jgi:hypothetical protein
MMSELDQPRAIIAMWDVSGETYQQMIEEAAADAALLMNGFEDKWEFEVLNCTPMEYEDSRITKWKGKAIIS